MHVCVAHLVVDDVDGAVALRHAVDLAEPYCLWKVKDEEG